MGALRGNLKDGCVQMIYNKGSLDLMRISIASVQYLFQFIVCWPTQLLFLLRLFTEPIHYFGSDNVAITVQALPIFS